MQKMGNGEAEASLRVFRSDRQTILRLAICCAMNSIIPRSLSSMRLRGRQNLAGKRAAADYL
jgi:hypothetical protein